MTITLIILGIWLIFELIGFSVYGFPVSKETAKLFMDIPQRKLNPYNMSILTGSPYIAKVSFSLFTKYYIDGVGTVWRWSKLHKRIEEYYKIALLKILNN